VWLFGMGTVAGGGEWGGEAHGAFVSGCEGPSIAELRSMRVVSYVKPNNLILSYP